VSPLELLFDPRARWMMIAVMVVGLCLNVSLTRAFDDAAWVFVACLLVIQVGRTLWMLTTHLDPITRDHFRRTLVWIAATAPLWIVGAALSAHVSALGAGRCGAPRALPWRR
jgi:low temperature requirement protein LtrA